MKSYHTDEKRVKTKKRTKSVKSYSLMRQEELERQCEEFFISLDNVDVEGESQEEVDDCDVLTPSLEEEHEEVVNKEPESGVRVEETESLKDSSLYEPRKEDAFACLLLCSCETCMREFQSCELDEVLVIKVGQNVTMDDVGVQWDLSSQILVNKYYIVLFPATQDLISYYDSCPTVKNNIQGGVEVFLGLNCLSVAMKRLGLLYPNDGVILFPTWTSPEKIKGEQEGCSCVIVLIFGNDIGFNSEELYLGWCHLNEMLRRCCQGCLVELFDGKGLRNLLELQLGRNCNQRGAYHSSLLICFYVDDCDLVFEVLIPWDVACEENEFIRNFLELLRAKNIGLRQWVRILIKYALTWFGWLIMKGASKGESFNLLWSVEKADKQCVGGGWDCRVLIMPWGSPEGDSSWEGKPNIFLTKKVQAGDCHGSGFKDASVRSPSLRGTVHNIVTMVELDDKTTSNSESLQLQDRTVEFIRKCSEFTELEIKAKDEVVVAVQVYGIIGNVNFLTKIRIPVAVISRAFNLNIQGLESNQMNYSLKKSGEDKLSQIFDIQGGSKAVKGVIAKMHCQKLNQYIWKADKIGERTECRDLCPFHYGRINCKMKIFQSSSNKNTIRLLNLSSKPMRLTLFDTRRMKLILWLNWMLKVIPTIEFKVAWVAVIDTKTVGTRASNDKTMMDVFEWMIAWGGQVSAEFIRQTILMMMIPWN